MIRVRTDKRNRLSSLKSCVPFLFHGSLHSLQPGFLRGGWGSKLRLPFPLSGRSITFTGTCRGERFPPALLYFLLSAPPCVHFCSRCVWLCAPLARFVFHALGAGAVLTRSCVFTAAAAAAAEGLGVPRCVLLDKAIRASLHGLLLGAPRNALTVVQKGHLPTNICSHCDSLARLHTPEEGRHAGVHMQTCRKETPHRG